MTTMLFDKIMKNEKAMFVVDFFYCMSATFLCIPKIKKRATSISDEMYRIGVCSIGVVLLTAVFTGIIAALQASFQFEGLAPDVFIGTAVLKSVVVELGPVMTAVVMAAKITTSTAADIGFMADREQLDAMYVLNLDPVEHLIFPRVVACVIMMPILVTFANIVAVFGGWLTALIILGIDTNTFVAGTRKMYASKDIVISLVKAVSFGFIVSYFGAFYGSKAKGGAVGVGKYAMKAVVSANVMIIIFNFIVAFLLF